MRSKIVLYLYLIIICFTLFNNLFNLTNTPFKVKISTLAEASTLKENIESEKKTICIAAKKLFERVVDEKKELTWEQVFDYMLLIFNSDQNNTRNRKVLINQAKEYCPTYKKAVEIFNEQQQQQQQL
jgi:hypothetical protein